MDSHKQSRIGKFDCDYLQTLKIRCNWPVVKCEFRKCTLCFDCFSHFLFTELSIWALFIALNWFRFWVWLQTDRCDGPPRVYNLPNPSAIPRSVFVLLRVTKNIKIKALHIWLCCCKLFAEFGGVSVEKQHRSYSVCMCHACFSVAIIDIFQINKR